MSSFHPSNHGRNAEVVHLPSDAQSAGGLLLDIAGRGPHGGSRRLFQEEKKMLDECFARAKGTAGFDHFHILATKQAVRSRNLEVVKLLLLADTTYQLLCGENDMLQVALTKTDRALRFDDDISLEVLPMLIDHGAQVNAVASNGDTALSLACEHGSRDVFKFLLEAGADCFTLHRSELPRRTDSQAPTEPVEALFEVNLLRVALNARLKAEGYGAAGTAYRESLEGKYGPIIGYLLRAGLRITPDDPALVKFLHVACYQGYEEYVEVILSHGVDVHAKAARVDDRDTVYGSALHAAAAGGHTDCVLRLLRYGADPRSARLQEYMKPYHQDKFLTPVAAALEADRFGSCDTPMKVLDACEAILEAGVDDGDRLLLIKQCAVSGDVELLRSLLRPGLIIDQVPVCSNIEAIKMLLEQGASIDGEAFEKYAVSEGLLELLEFLVTKYGPLITQVETLPGVVSGVPQRKHGAAGVIRYLIRDYGHSVSGVPSIHSDMANQLLYILCRSPEGGLVRSLLQDAARSGCPGIHDSALTTLVTMLHQYQHDPYRINDKVTKAQVQMYQLLLEFSEQSNYTEGSHSGKLWLTPDKVPEHVWDRVRSMPIEPLHTSRFPINDAKSDFSDPSEGSLTPPPVEDDDKVVEKSQGSTPSASEPMDNAEVGPIPDPAVSWVAHLDPISGQYYYLHLPTQSTHWECPPELAPTIALDEPPLSPAGNASADGPPSGDVVSASTLTRRSKSLVEDDLVSKASDAKFVRGDPETINHYSAEDSYPTDQSTEDNITNEISLHAQISPPPSAYHCSLCAKNYQFKYDRLDGSYAIRLVVIEPSTTPSAPVQCQLTTTNLGEYAVYEALSYVWGDIEDTLDISLGGNPFVVTRNLRTALRRLRLPDKERMLWVDAICINQNLITERNQQVSLAVIYQRPKLFASTISTAKRVQCRRPLTRFPTSPNLQRAAYLGQKKLLL